MLSSNTQDKIEVNEMGKRWTPQDIEKMNKVMMENLDKEYQELIDHLYLEFPDRDRESLGPALRAFLHITKIRDVHGFYVWDKFREMQIKSIAMNKHEARDRLNNPVTIKDRLPKNIETVKKEMDNMHQNMCDKLGMKQCYMNAGVVFSTNDITKAKALLEQVVSLVQEADVCNYTYAADAGRLFIMKSPKLVSGGEQCQTSMRQ